MRIEDGLSKQFLDMGFTSLGTNQSSIHLFYRSVNDEVNVILILRALYGDELTPHDYGILISNIKSKFISNGFGEVRLLGIIITAAPDQAKHFCIEEGNHWLIDLANRRLIIYENQTSEDFNLRQQVEQVLYDERYDEENLEWVIKNARTGNNSVLKRSGWITLINTTIIAANILLYLIVHYTKIFGGTELIMAEGALSWYFVKEQGEYHRIFTSMFLHNDFGHLINNMLVLFFVGDNLERAAGKLKFLIIYFGSGILAGISSISYNMLKAEHVFSIGASGAIFGVVGAMGYILVRNKGRLEDISSRQILLFTIFSLYGGISSVNIDNAAHIGGFFAGILLALILYRKPKKNISPKDTDYAEWLQEER